MKLQHLSPTDLAILKATENIVDGIAAMYGEYTEVLLHSLDIDNPAIVKIANGHVTDRSIGAPITNLAMTKLNQAQDISDSYFSKTATGKTLRSITTIIRNGAGNAIGLLCINSDLDAPLQAVMQTMLHGTEALTPASSSPEIFARNIDESLQTTIDTIGHDVRNDQGIAPSKKNREIVIRLHELGCFELKDSTQIAAKRLDISVHTIYRYQRAIRDNL